MQALPLRLVAGATIATVLAARGIQAERVPEVGKAHWIHRAAVAQELPRHRQPRRGGEGDEEGDFF